MADAPGTCHLVGCPQKGQHAPHGIGTGRWEDYATPEYCLGFPVATACGIGDATIHVRCSISPETWRVTVSNLDPKAMAALVDDHKANCTNRRKT